MLRSTPELEVLVPAKATLDSPSSLTLRSSIVGVYLSCKVWVKSVPHSITIQDIVLRTLQCMQRASEGFGTLEARQGCQVQGGHGKGDSRARDDEPDDDMRGNVSLSF